ncbi:uncharacterized protein TRIADDRAFT_62837 [Trichoplax adhaerens]|uniref:Uncharacterized protein n=1 Tax=Trichoplax adhaerens TaxID=10228 RepID=B3SF15_TRIAD|nr:predicted protein [Trichoplax adhaerens]EDV18679.1 predicted protein [Trichoplax adhaerens]|eukprot:XP_002118834.1 predicted protein [Trichoplax adhaerens]
MMASLRRTGNLAVILSKTMQWSSTFQMISHCFELKPYLDLQDPELAKLLPSPKDDVKLTEKMKDLAAFESVYHKLFYSPDIDHNTLRQLFDALIRQFPQLDLYLAADSVRVYSVAFETGIAKIITGQEPSLTKDEQEVCQPFRVIDDTADKSAMDSIINDNLSFAEKVLSKQTSKVTKSSAYEDVSYIPVMSTVTQQLTRNNIIDLTKSNDVMNPIYLRCIFLKLNRRLWDLPLLKKVVHRST